MALFARLLLILGTCLGAVGAAGFAEPVEPEAWPLFVAGVVLILAGGILLRRELRRRAAAGGEGAPTREELAGALRDLSAEVARLDDERNSLDREALRARIDALLAGPFFELGRRSEDYSRALGASVFAELWEGFAVSERLLARAWSMATDDHVEEAREELGRARRPIASAAVRAGTEENHGDH